MDKLAKLITDIGKLWETYSGAYFTGIRNTLVLAVVATLIGCDASPDFTANLTSSSLFASL